MLLGELPVPSAYAHKGASPRKRGCSLYGRVYQRLWQLAAKDAPVGYYCSKKMALDGSELKAIGTTIGIAGGHTSNQDLPMVCDTCPNPNALHIYNHAACL